MSLDRARLDFLIRKQAQASAAASRRSSERAARQAERERKAAEREAEQEAFEAEFGTRAERARASAARRAAAEARRAEAERLRQVRDARELYGFEDFTREAPEGALQSLIAFWTGTAPLDQATGDFLGKLRSRIAWDLSEQDFGDWLLRRWRSYAGRLRGLVPRGPSSPPPTLRSPVRHRRG